MYMIILIALFSIWNLSFCTGTIFQSIYYTIHRMYQQLLEHVYMGQILSS